MGFCVTQAPAGSKTALAERAEGDLLIALTGNGPVNIINIITIEPRFERWLKPVVLLCALKICLKRAGAERASNLGSDDFDSMT